MNIEALRDYCVSKPYVTEHFPFDKDTLVFKVHHKMFALASLKRWEAGDGFINLKCDPEKALALREQYSSIKPGYHMHKQHWNSVYAQHGMLPIDLIKILIDDSYQLVFDNLPKRLQKL